MIKIFHSIKNFFKNSPNLTSLGISSGISNLIGGIFWFYIASILGTELYGEVSYLLSIAIIGSTISLLGSTNTIIVYTAKKIKIQSSIFLVAIVSALVSASILFVLFSESFGISIFVIGYVTFALITSDFLGKKFFVRYSKFIVSQKICQVVLSILLYYILGVNGIILGIGLSFIPFGLFILKEFKISEINFSLLKTHSGFMANNYFLDINRSLEGSIDKIILAPIIGFSLLGNFQLGVQFLSILTILPVVVFQYTLPNDASGTSVLRVKKIVIVFSILLAFLSFILCPLLLPLVFPEYVEAIIVIQIMSLAIIPFTITTTFTSKFLGFEKSRYVLIGSGIFLIIQISGIILLGTYFGIIGAAISILIGRIGETVYYFVVDKLQSNKT